MVPIIKSKSVNEKASASGSKSVKTVEGSLFSWEDKTAKAVCTFAYTESKDSEVKLFKGECPGLIVDSRGPETFGWDSCFQPDGYTKTFAEMTKDKKNEISHRSRALAKLKTFFIDMKDCE